MDRAMTNWDLFNTLVLSVLLGFQWTIGHEGFAIGIITFLIVMIGYMIKYK